jgi:hypothetical protein
VHETLIIAIPQLAGSERFAVLQPVQPAGHRILFSHINLSVRPEHDMIMPSKKTRATKKVLSLLYHKALWSNGSADGWEFWKNCSRKMRRLASGNGDGRHCVLGCPTESSWEHLAIRLIERLQGTDRQEPVRPLL